MKASGHIHVNRSNDVDVCISLDGYRVDTQLFKVDLDSVIWSHFVLRDFDLGKFALLAINIVLEVQDEVLLPEMVEEAEAEKLDIAFGLEDDSILIAGIKSHVEVSMSLEIR
jgi:hypothetical protein